MARQPKPAKKGQRVRVIVVLSGGLVADIDAAAARLAVEVPGSSVTRSEVIRRALYQFVKKS